ncbi:MAG: transcriptional regulator LldR [Planctomycetaceae bacterium]|nr:transcriptional regulator LldR [Planctomycetaceae bacterium]
MTISASSPTAAHQSLPSVWDSISTLVQDRGLQVGDQLPSIRELAERLEVKQSSVRDALLKAESLGFVKILPRSGAFLRVPGLTLAKVAAPIEMAPADAILSALNSDEHNLFHLLDARRLIEIELAGRTAERRRLEDLLPIRRALEAMLHLTDATARQEYVDLDIRFHLEIARLSGNSVLFAIQQTLMELLRPHLNEVPRDLQRKSITDRSHIAIYETLVSGSADRARVEMRQHLSLAYDSMLRDIQEPPAMM